MFQYFKTRATAIAAILWLIVLTPQTNAQTPTLTATYSVKKGLPSSTINHIVEDNNNGILDCNRKWYKNYPSATKSMA